MEPVRIPPFESFYAEHKDPVFAHLRRLLGSGAEDAFQETFLRALRAYPELRKEIAGRAQAVQRELGLSRVRVS